MYSVLRMFDGLGLPEQLRPTHLIQSIQRAGARLREDLSAPWRYNAQPQRNKKRKWGVEAASAPTVQVPELAISADVLPEQLSNADAVALFEAAQAAGRNKQVTFLNSVNAG